MCCRQGCGRGGNLGSRHLNHRPAPARYERVESGMKWSISSRCRSYQKKGQSLRSGIAGEIHNSNVASLEYVEPPCLAVWVTDKFTVEPPVLICLPLGHGSGNYVRPGTGRAQDGEAHRNHVAKSWEKRRKSGIQAFDKNIRIKIDRLLIAGIERSKQAFEEGKIRSGKALQGYAVRHRLWRTIRMNFLEIDSTQLSLEHLESGHQTDTKKRLGNRSEALACKLLTLQVILVAGAGFEPATFRL